MIPSQKLQDKGGLNVDKRDAEIISQLSKISTGELERRLQMAFLSDSVSDEEVCVLSEILEQRKKNEADAEKERAMAEEAWDNFVKRHPTLIAVKSSDSVDDIADEVMEEPQEGIEKSEKHVFGKKHLAAWKKVAALAACFGLVVTLFTIPSVKAELSIAEWASQYFRFVDQKGGDATFDINASEETDFDTIEEALEAYHITEPLLPTWMPEGFELEGIRVMKGTSSVEFSSLYRCNNKTLKVLIRAYDDMDALDSKTAKNDEVPKIVNINKIEHYMFSNEQRYTVTWINRCYECNISGEVSFDELKQMVKSIYK